MRFTSVELVAYGHFTEKHIDLSETPIGVHVVYGPNEAGKTTLKSAIEELLFGIQIQTPYAFLHPYAKLCIRASLTNAAKDTIIFERVKRRTGDIRAIDGNPLPQDALSPFLRGMNREAFCSQFSLTRNDMIKGSKDILAGEGELGASLYSAALGNKSLAEIIKRLEEEAKDIFSRSKPLNKAFDAFDSARAALREALIRPDAWELKVRDQEALVARISSLDERIGTLAASVGLLERLRAQAQSYDRIIALRARLTERADEIVVPQDAIAQCQTYMTQRQEALTTYNATNERIALLMIGKDAEKESALLTHVPTIRALTRKVGTYTKGLDDLKRLDLRGHAIRNAEEARQFLHRVWPDVDIELARTRVVSQVTLSRGNELAMIFMTLSADSKTAKAAEQRLRDQMTETNAELDALPTARDVTALSAVIDTATFEGQLDATISQSQGQVQAQQEGAETKLSALGLFMGTLEALVAAPLPLPETIARFKVDFEAIALEETMTLTRRDDAWELRVGSEEKLKSLTEDGALHTVADLAEARTRRDAIFESLEQQWRANASTAELDATSDRYRPVVTGTDNLADELGRHADRVARIEQLQEQRDAATVAIEEYDAALKAVSVRRAELSEEWVAEWVALNITPRSPEEMGSWLQHALEVRRLVDALKDRRAKLAECLARRSLLAKALRRELATVVGTAPSGEMLKPVLLAATALVAEVKTLEEDRTRLNRDLARDQREVTRQRKKHVDAQAALATWLESWLPVLDAASLSHNLAPAVFAETIALIERFHKADRDARADHSRADGIERDNEQFRSDVLAFVAEHALDLEPIAKTTPDAVVDTLNERLTAAQVARTKREERQHQLEVEQQTLTLAQTKVDGSEAALMVIAKQFRIEREALQSVAVRSKETLTMREAFDTGCEEIETVIGRSLDECEREYDGRDREDIDSALSVAEAQQRELRSDRDALIEQRRDIDATLVSMDTSQIAADADADLIAIGATIDREGRRWVELSLARHILDQQVREYAEKHQGPLIERSGQYFNQLTGGAYVKLRAVAEDNKNILEAVDQTGQGTPIDGLSDGTCDQLYFALRLAALEEYFKTNEPQPVILDDTFVQFDDERTRFAFQALAEFSKSTQVLYFTHHRSCVDAAQQAVPNDILAVHELESRWTDAAQSNGAALAGVSG